MSYKQMSSSSARDLRDSDRKYGVYMADTKNAVLVRVDSKECDGMARNGRQCMYLVDSGKKSIRFSEICKNADKYNVIFIVPENYDTIESTRDAVWNLH